MAYNPANPQGNYNPTNASTYTPTNKKKKTNNIPGFDNSTLINVQQGYVAPAKGTTPGINNDSTLINAQMGKKITTIKTKKSTDPFKIAKEKAASMTQKEKQDLFNKQKTGNKKIDKALEDIAKENPTMAGVFADYVKKSGVGVVPLVTPIETTPKPVKVIPSAITTPGLEPTSEALIKAQSAIQPVKVDVTEGKPAKDKADEITGGAEEITKEDSDKIKTDLNNQEADALDKATTPEQKNNIIEYFNKLQNEITRRTISQLKAGKEQAMIGLGQAQAALVPQYESQRARAVTQSMQQARNFSEYLAARGQATSGLAAQAELSRGAGLTRQLGEIGQQQQSAQDQLNANKAKIQSDFQLAVANAKSDAEIAKLNQAFQQAIKAEDRAYNEKITADNRAYAAKLLAEDKEYQDMLFKRNRAIELGDRAAAQAYEKQMIDYRAGVELNLAEQKAALQPQKEAEYNYATDPDFAEVYNQIASGQVLQYKRQADVGFPDRRTLVKTDPQTIYKNVISDRINLTNAFGEQGYKILVDTAKELISKTTTVPELTTQLNTGNTNINQ